MKDNTPLILLAIPMTILLWLGARFYVNPGKPAPWNLAELKRASTPSAGAILLTPQPLTSAKSADQNGSQPEDAKKSAHDNKESAQRSSENSASQTDKKNQHATPNNGNVVSTTADQPVQEKLAAETAVPSGVPQVVKDPFKSVASVLDENLFADPLAEQPPQVNLNPGETEISADSSNGYGTNLTEQNPKQTSDITRTQSVQVEINEMNSATDTDTNTEVQQLRDIGPEHALTATFATQIQGCVNELTSPAVVEINFSKRTAAIKSESLAKLDDIIQLYHQCGQGEISLYHAIPIDSNNKSLQRRRQDEVKYHLRHMQVATTDIVLPE